LEVLLGTALQRRVSRSRRDLRLECVGRWASAVDLEDAWRMVLSPTVFPAEDRPAVLQGAQLALAIGLPLASDVLVGGANSTLAANLMELLYSQTSRMSHPSTLLRRQAAGSFLSQHDLWLEMWEQRVMEPALGCVQMIDCGMPSTRWTPTSDVGVVYFTFGFTDHFAELVSPPGRHVVFARPVHAEPCERALAREAAHAAR
jgi:hypothetical protein